MPNNLVKPIGRKRRLPQAYQCVNARSQTVILALKDHTRTSICRCYSHPLSPLFLPEVLNPDLRHLIQHFEAKSLDSSLNGIAFPSEVLPSWIRWFQNSLNTLLFSVSPYGSCVELVFTPSSERNQAHSISNH